MQVRLEKKAIKIVKAFGERQKIKTLSKAQLVNALLEEYDRMMQAKKQNTPLTT